MSHDTLSQFRVEHLEVLQQVFTDVLLALGRLACRSQVDVEGAVAELLEAHVKNTRNPFAVTQEDGASLLNQLGFVLVLLPAVILSQTDAASLACSASGEELHYIAEVTEECWAPGVALALVFGASAFIGAVGGGLFAAGRAPLRAGLLGGALACLGGAMTTHFALAHRERFFILEAVLIWLFGCGPGVLTYKALVDRAAEAHRR